MAKPKISSLPEPIKACLRFVLEMLSVDRTVGITMVLCWLVQLLSDVFLVGINARGRTAIQQLLSDAVPRSQLMPLLTNLFIMKISLTTLSVGVENLATASETKIKKKMRMNFTVRLIESFSSLDFVTQSDPSVYKEFELAHHILNDSVIAKPREIIFAIEMLTKILLLLGSLLLQIRGKDEFILLLVVALLFGIQGFMLYGITPLIHL